MVPLSLSTAAILITIILVSLLVIYIRRYRSHPPDVFVPEAAWLRAIIYFCSCYLVAITTGVVEDMRSNPVASTWQLADKLWWLWVGGLILLVTAAYWGVWARYTLRFDRRRALIPQTIFGVLWGAASGMLFLSFYKIVQSIGVAWKPWQEWLFAYALIAFWQWIWQDYYWDVYISPEHDSPLSIKIKVLATHIPNITACLIFYAIYQNSFLFVGLQTWALLGASLAMRMPAPWSKEDTPPATRSPGLFGFPRASGYISDDPENDPYLQAAHLPR
jgi:hypothetical protein